MAWKLWIDDQWDDPNTPVRHPPSDFTPARSSTEAIVLVLEKGLPSYMSLDHDLGEGDDVIQFIDWLSGHHYDDEIPQYQIHSANPIGAANIQAKLESWRKSKTL